MLLNIDYNMRKEKGMGGKHLPSTAGITGGHAKEFGKAHGIPSTENTDPLIGTRLSDRYRIKEKVGEGGMGMIYLAEDERLGKEVVVKMLPPDFAGKEDVGKRFAQEAKITSQMEHENIVFITDLVLTSPPFYAMEYLKGKDLGTMLHEGGRLAWDERTKDILTQVCRALGAAHEKGVIHRDMKPGNIFIVPHSDGREFVKVIDFGIAKLLSDGVGEEKTGEAEGKIRARPRNLTSVGAVMGTPAYMAPEQCTGEEIDHRVDIYAMGVIMYEMLTGTAPFDVPEGTGSSVDIAAKIMMMHSTEPVVAPSIRRPEAEIPEEVEAIILKALRKAPEERYGSIMEMEAALAKRPAPKHRPKAKITHDASASETRSLEGLARIREMEAARRRMAKVRSGILIGALAAAAAGGAAAAVFHGSQPAVDRQTSAVEEK
jgi:serine/threonine-protein kinase